MFVFRGADKVFLGIVVILTVAGFFIFASASLGMLAKEQYDLQHVLTKQLLFGVGGGTLALMIMTAVHYRVWRKYALVLFIATIGISLLTFTPLGREYNSARRWIEFGSFSMQPSELLKIGYILYLAAWLSRVRAAIDTLTGGILPFLGITSVVASIMYFQRDTDSLLVLVVGGVAILFAVGARLKTVAIVCFILLMILAGIVLSREYLKDRVNEYLFGDEKTELSTGWHGRQASIAIGSGGMRGRGYGQSIQKFGNLPEAAGDAVFAVYAEEFGFIGSVVLISLFYFFFMLRGYRIASHARDVFGTLVVVGIITMLMMQISINIAAMTGIIPLVGLTLPFISLGGTSLLVTLATLGVVLSVSKHQRTIR